MWHLAGLEIDYLLKTWQQAISYPKAVDDYASIIHGWFGYGQCGSLTDISYNNYSGMFITKEFSQKMVNWATSREVIDIFFKQVSLAIENIDTLNEWQLETYDSVLKLKEIRRHHEKSRPR
ncbi:hypothetical protein [Psychrobacter sp. I-STPA6b]|uniref:hypothetical protein n=1 Tax=Psychrobacter sp. I-STPA6b TaxID=2585718 RepID=UPI001D0CB6C9|nr:hypothetical protein [Psychrobacter sp. I-STPA6b]